MVVYLSRLALLPPLSFSSKSLTAYISSHVVEVADGPLRGLLRRYSRRHLHAFGFVHTLNALHVVVAVCIVLVDVFVVVIDISVVFSDVVIVMVNVVVDLNSLVSVLNGNFKCLNVISALL